ncbi:hypothetical protein [Saccharopolyspora sp. 5N708]|uniref:hypothetical protein n=1 Tax=Saccharopolyspora sp. 5N708 TaxID=3457424 RepID=UPI003FD0BAE2
MGEERPPAWDRVGASSGANPPPADHELGKAQPFAPPKTYQGGAATGSTGIGVDGAALKVTADAFDQLLPRIDEVLAELRKVDVRPGAPNFAMAKAIQDKIGAGGLSEGTGALRDQYVQSLLNMRDAFVEVRDGLRQAEKDYGKAEADNSTAAQRIANLFSEAAGYLAPEGMSAPAASAQPNSFGTPVGGQSAGGGRPPLS